MLFFEEFFGEILVGVFRESFERGFGGILNKICEEFLGIFGYNFL
jgi:hypothetical protein